MNTSKEPTDLASKRLKGNKHYRVLNLQAQDLLKSHYSYWWYKFEIIFTLKIICINCEEIIEY